MSEIQLQAVLNLLGSYGILLDQLAVEEWLDLFTDDAVLDVNGSLLDSRDKRRGLATSAPRGLHVTNMPAIRGELGSRELSVTSTFLFWSAESSTARIGWYDDSLVRSGPRWLFSARRISFLDEG